MTMTKDEVIEAIAKKMVTNRWNEETWETGLGGMTPVITEAWRENWRKEARGLVSIISPLWDEAIDNADRYKQQLDEIFQAATDLMHKCEDLGLDDDPFDVLEDVARDIFTRILLPFQPSEIPLESLTEEDKELREIEEHVTIQE